METHNTNSLKSTPPAPLRILIAGGGTGGHLFPAIAIAEAFLARQPQTEALFVGTGNPFERSVLAKKGFEQARIKIEGIKGRGVWRQIRAVFRLPGAIVSSMRILLRFKPDLVIGVGSYSAGPVVAAAWLLRIKTVLHEQNMLPGITNRMLAPLAERIYVSFEHTGTYFDPRKIKLTGNPVRREILTCSNAEDRTGPKAPRAGQAFTILVIGGSQGAHSINMAVIDALSRLREKQRFHVIHQTGSQDEILVQQAYASQGVAARVQAFFDDIARQYQNADLIICRAGATTVAEITSIGKGIIFIPYPFAADDHQVLNARTLADAGAAEMILERDLDAEILAARIEHYASNPELLAQMESRSRGFRTPRGG